MGATANSVAAAKSVTIGSGSLPVMAPSSDATVHPTGSPALTKATQTGTVGRLKHGGPQEAQSAEASGRYEVRPVGAHTIKKKRACNAGEVSGASNRFKSSPPLPPGSTAHTM